MGLVGGADGQRASDAHPRPARDRHPRPPQHAAAGEHGSLRAAAAAAPATGPERGLLINQLDAYPPTYDTTTAIPYHAIPASMNAEILYQYVILMIRGSTLGIFKIELKVTYVDK